ncbi:transforming growth factor beta activator LRRC32 isoform X1 [Dunckerocampus dactyliophorus]|uniref:transforming growth factor beta activator LRRC32 isoform X1 n=2 Tax=Dunckerocampus dactyliophorus TaxID=161453 RepID=UPI0024073DA1|nr:transforming growth factor beta activator LRRC32 isoform X1 [Dunckerocampus dactyliophorus]XP_054612013.1 transforming growth factor beta activator LRRC32 isoform X1 [Dunckerocampus dactyliophorus]
MAALPLLLALLIRGMASAAHHPRLPRHRPSCHMVQMSVVVCSNLSLTGAPVNLPPGIETLDLSHNQVQNLTRDTLAYRTDLRHLNLHSNKIHFIQPGLFEDMTNLKILDLSRNHLNVFALTKNKIGTLAAVETLDLSSNGLYTGMSDFLIADSPSLVELSLNSNSITKIAQNTFRGALSLRKVSLHNNVILEIEDGAFDSLDCLTELDLSKNSITCITDFNLSRLKVLNLSKNSLEIFQSTRLTDVYDLVFLDLSENKLPCFPLLPANNSIQHLDLSRNQLQSVNMTDTPERKTHVVLNHLRYLDLSYNQLKDIPQSFFHTMTSLEVLNVSNNCIDSFLIVDKDLLPAVKIINLNYNSLQRLSFGEATLQSLKELLLRGNDLSTLEQQTLQRLPSLNLLQLQENNLRVCPWDTKPCPSDHNRLHPPDCVYFSCIPNLKYLYLSQNNLKSLPFSAFADTPLTLLDLSLNPGLEMHPDSLSGLEHTLVHLFLRENNISKLNTELSSLRSLRLVDLSTNQLTSLPAWSKESSIETLNLHNNSLVTLEHSTMIALERSLKTLYVGSNPLSCCGNLGFLHLVQHSTVVVPDIETVTCLLREDSEPVNIEKVSREMCHSPKKVNYIIVVVVFVLFAMIMSGLMVKYCKSRKRKHVRRFIA